MKKNSFLWAALSMTAALVMTACSNDDNANESPVQQSTVKTIPYSVTVNEGATTRATVDSDNKTLKFADGDKLYVTGTNIKGVLDIQTGMGTASATFSGDLTYTGGGSPASDLSLTATLVSAQQNVGTEVSVDAAGAVTVNYPSTAYCTSVNDAVQKYSNLTGTSTYSSKSFTLSQNTAFLNFEITFVDGTSTGTALSAVVKNGITNLCTANVTTTTVDTKVVAKFVLPVEAGTTLSSATVKMGGKAARTIKNATLTGKVYNVKKTQKIVATPHTLAASSVGDVIVTNGNAYTLDDTHELPSGVTAVAMVAYKSATTGKSLAIALADEGSMDWESAKTKCTGKAAIGGKSWKLPSQDEWTQMFSANGGNGGSYTGLNAAITSAGGTALEGNNGDYWSSSATGDDDLRWRVHLYGSGDAIWSKAYVGTAYRVRACFAF